MKRILLIDDDLLYLSIYEDLLGEAYLVDAVLDAEEAFRKLQEETYDLVITDIYMPNMNGYGVAEMIRSEMRLNVPILFISAQSKTPYALLYSNSLFLGKDTDSRTFICTVKTMVGDG